MKVSERTVTKEDVIKALGDRPSAEALRKLDIRAELCIEPYTPSGWLCACVVWQTTPQGHDYWSKENDWLLKQERKDK